jgi:hypothetical protein
MCCLDCRPFGRLAVRSANLPNADCSHKNCEMAPPVVADGTVAAVTAAGRGQGYSEMENLLIAKAYIAASEDPIKGNYQKAATIMETVHTNYIALCVEQTKINYLDVAKMAMNTHRGTKLVAKPPLSAAERPTNAYNPRTNTAVWGQFKSKIAKECMVYAGIVATHLPLSGDAAGDLRLRWLAVYKSREGGDFKYENCWDFLKDKPKWKVYVDKAVNKIGARAKMGRPKGVKKAKKDKLDVEEVELIIKAEQAKVTDSATNGGAMMATFSGDFMRGFNKKMSSFESFGQGVMVSVSSPETKAQLKMEKQLEMQAKHLAMQSHHVDIQAKQVALDMQKVDLVRAQTKAQKEQLDLKKEQLLLESATKKAKLDHRRASIVAKATATLAASMESSSVPSAVDFTSDCDDLYD